MEAILWCVLNLPAVKDSIQSLLCQKVTVDQYDVLQHVHVVLHIKPTLMRIANASLSKQAIENFNIPVCHGLLDIHCMTRYLSCFVQRDSFDCIRLI